MARFQPLRISLVLLAAVGLFPSMAAAHGVSVTASVDGSVIRGKAAWAGGTPIRGASVRALDPSGEELGRTTTDEQGRFEIEVTSACDHRLLVDTGDGHGGECTVTVSRLPSEPSTPDAASPAASNVDMEAIRSELAEIRSRLETLEQTVRWRDILGALGYIFGIAGVAFYFLGVLRREKRGR